MRTSLRVAVICALSVVAAPITARAQSPSRGNAPASPFLGGVPTAESPGPPISLTLSDALKRGLQQNLGVILESQRLEQAEGNRWRLLSGLLPDVSGVIRQTREKVNLAAFGFSGFPGVPSIIGPFNVFDARVGIRQPVLDVGAIYEARQAGAQLKAAKFGYEDARTTVLLVVTNLYLQTLASDSRVAAATADAETAESLYRLAVDQNNAGIVPRLDVLRADVERKAGAHRRIAAENDAVRARAGLARAIGLPSGQVFTLADPMAFSPLAEIEPATARLQAFSRRPDVLRAQARVDAADAALQAARAARLPSLSVDGNIGRIGNSASTSETTFAVAANVNIPLFSARDEARTIESRAELRQRQAELDDLRAGVAYEIDIALRDVRDAAEQVAVAESATSVAAEALTQAQNRFRAGIATNIEVVQAQEAQVATREAYIAALYSHNLAKAALARTVGVSDADFIGFLGGQAPWQIR